MSRLVFSAPFFEECINEQDLDEMNIEIIRNTLYKSYLESFFNFCRNIGGETEEVMCEILAFEADRRAFIITINSFGTELTKDDREKLYPTCGKLYPDGLKALARADDYDQVRSVAEYYSVIAFTDIQFCYDFTIAAMVISGLQTMLRGSWHKSRRKDSRGQVL